MSGGQTPFSEVKYSVVSPSTVISEETHNTKCEVHFHDGTMDSIRREGGTSKKRKKKKKKRSKSKEREEDKRNDGECVAGTDCRGEDNAENGELARINESRDIQHLPQRSGKHQDVRKTKKRKPDESVTVTAVITEPTSKQRRIENPQANAIRGRPDFAFKVDDADHCETPIRAYRDIVAILDKLSVR